MEISPDYITWGEEGGEVINNLRGRMWLHKNLGDGDIKKFQR